MQALCVIPATIGRRSSADVRSVGEDEPLDRLSHLWRAYPVTQLPNFSRNDAKVLYGQRLKILDVLQLVGTSYNSPRTRKPIVLVRLTGNLVPLAMMLNGHRSRFEMGHIWGVGISQVSLD